MLQRFLRVLKKIKLKNRSMSGFFISSLSYQSLITLLIIEFPKDDFILT